MFLATAEHRKYEQQGHDANMFHLIHSSSCLPKPGLFGIPLEAMNPTPFPLSSDPDTPLRLISPHIPFDKYTVHLTQNTTNLAPASESPEFPVAGFHRLQENWTKMPFQEIATNVVRHGIFERAHGT